MLPLDEGKKVESIEYLPPEMVPETPLGKNSIVDVRCEESGLNDAERAAYEGFWDRVSIEATKKAYADRVVAERDAAVAKLDAAKARADAATEKLRQTVCRLKKIGMPVEQIANVTGLAAAEIAAL